MSGRIPAIIPQISAYMNRPKVYWQDICATHLQQLLADYPFRNPNTEHLLFYYRNNHNEHPSQGIQVLDGNWTLHVQCMFHGDEEKLPSNRYELSPSRILISLDLEKGPQSRGANHEESLLQQSVISAISEIARTELGSNIKIRQLHGKGHHLIWESMQFSEDSEPSARHVAERMAKYVKVLMQVALDVMAEWANRINNPTIIS